MRKRIAIFLVGWLLTSGCGVDREPMCEEWIEGAYRPGAVTACEIAGSRDGATTSAVATMTLGGGDVLRMEIEVVYDPAPVLRSGRWSIEGSRTGSGEVAAESVRFLGGQGEGPSIGGRYRLNENGRPRFRVDLPPRPIGQRDWAVD